MGSWPLPHECLQEVDSKDEVQAHHGLTRFRPIYHRLECVPLSSSLFTLSPAPPTHFVTLFHAHLYAWHLPSDINPPIHTYLHFSSVRASQEVSDTNFWTIDDPDQEGS